MLVAPTEPRALQRIGTTSSIPERFGVDFMWIVGAGEDVDDRRVFKFGVQRKEWKDLVQSFEDGRWAREVPMMRGLSRAWVVVEGWPQFGPDGVLVDKTFGRTWTFDALWGHLWSATASGVGLGWTKHTAETGLWVAALDRWTRKGKHTSHLTRPGPDSVWGRPTNREYAMHLLQGLPGVGPELAGRVWEHFGRLPWAWTVGEDELREVRGVGKKKAAKMIRALGIAEGWDL